jgi:tRNA modification GTPase
MHAEGDTIAAIATAPGEAGIAIVRLSGSRSLDIADRIFRGRGPFPSQRPGHSFVYGRVLSAGAGGEPVEMDEVILLIYRAPHSYTREDVVEIQGHGGRICAQRILRAALAAGAKMAEPGEFTRRAFENGRIDLVQAEAVLDLVRATSERAASSAIEQLEGNLSRSIQKCYDDTIVILADLEASFDFPDDDLPENLLVGLPDRILSVAHQLRQLLATWEEGHLLRDGALAVISGLPNVGKSTLLNRLLGRERAIVTEIPGTTRDTIEELAILEGIPVRLVDTAGLREAACQIEREGVERARRVMRQADVNLYVIDSSQPIREEDRANLDEMGSRRCIVILNKTDLGARQNSADYSPLPAIPCSLITSVGISDIRQAIITSLNVDVSAPPRAAVSERHRQLINRSVTALEEALELSKTGVDDHPIQCAGMLRDSVESMALILGKTFHNDLLDKIFNTFCIGK